jgi:hypothetical protein
MRPPAGAVTPNREPDHKETKLLMANENPTGDGADDGATTAALDLRDQTAVLDLILSNWPTHLTVGDLRREIGASDFAERDRIDRAVRDLNAAGLTFDGCGAVLPTRAALHFDRMEKAR